MSRVVRIAGQVGSDGASKGRNCWLWCPGCEAAHRVQIVGEDGSVPDGPTWQWNGRDDERFGVEPSILCHGSVHLCEPREHTVECPNPGECGSTGHLILNAERGKYELPPETERVLGHLTPHTAEPAWGNCHSFLRDGQWQFLGDSAHHLAGQTVPMVPLPDWLDRQ